MIMKPKKTETLLKNKKRYKFTLPLLILDFAILLFLGYELNFSNAVMFFLSIFFLLVLLVYICSIISSKEFILLSYCDPLSYLKINKAGEGKNSEKRENELYFVTSYYLGYYDDCIKRGKYMLYKYDYKPKRQASILLQIMFSYFYTGDMQNALKTAEEYHNIIQNMKQKYKDVFMPQYDFIINYYNCKFAEAITCVLQSNSLPDIMKSEFFYLTAQCSRAINDEQSYIFNLQQILKIDNKTCFYTAALQQVNEMAVKNNLQQKNA